LAKAVFDQICQKWLDARPSVAGAEIWYISGATCYFCIYFVLGVFYVFSVTLLGLSL